jgi:hypothetical protein
MDNRDFVEIGSYRSSGGSGTWFLIYECPSCFSFMRVSVIDAHIDWHKGLMEGWDDA